MLVCGDVVFSLVKQVIRYNDFEQLRTGTERGNTPIVAYISFVFLFMHRKHVGRFPTGREGSGSERQIEQVHQR